ncbi:putative retrotransposon hot spot (RHS) protein [Trypanosoma conorhini]|uniref:Putative retrotransposon hot spot (RHS) protein n=1 Tax=Trypanosoma conorhini TaxID=83891 RepID=A0A3R7RFM1_9TRYP|nr:putative retrotransposon hot spot (RHS) protein [Trypanosoma conorhini]RNF01728.1 putative retrotransposon hot spot (RHS) protein [Trypanosoma conorhini]
MWRGFVRFHVAMRQKLCVSIVAARAAAVRPRGVRSTPQPQLCVGDACARWPRAGGVRGVLHPSFLLMERRRVSGGGAQSAQGQGREQRSKQQWTLATSVEDVLLEGVNATEQMELNDFISKYLGPKFVADEGRGVKLGAFIQGPEDCISDERLLRRILNSQAYQLLRDARKLAGQGVSSLAQ